MEEIKKESVSTCTIKVTESFDNIIWITILKYIPMEELLNVVYCGNRFLRKFLQDENYFTLKSLMRHMRITRQFKATDLPAR